MPGYYLLHITNYYLSSIIFINRSHFVSRHCLLEYTIVFPHQRVAIEVVLFGTYGEGYEGLAGSEGNARSPVGEAERFRLATSCC